MNYELQIYLSCRNEESSIEEAILSVRKVILESGISAEIIVVDNASEDATSAKAIELANGITGLRIISLSHNKSYSGSIFESLSDAKSEFVVILDGDCQFPPTYIPHLLDSLRNSDLEVVFSNRTHLEGDLWRKFASKFFLKMLRIMLRFDGPDINAGLRGFKKDSINHFQGLQMGRLANASLWHQATKAGLAIGYIDVAPVARVSGTSSIPWKNPFKLFWESLIEIRKVKNEEFEYIFKEPV
jgi:glucosyltransferase